jgi:hypothetical protein
MPEPMNYQTDKNDPLGAGLRTINPYRIGLGLIYRRLLWDLSFQAWSSRKRLRTWRNRYSGQKAVIVCNGPSLNDTDLSLLSGTFTFGLNKINLIFPRNDFRPSCIVAVNPFVIIQNADFFNATSIPLFLDSYAKSQKVVNPLPNICYLHSGPRGFAQDCSISISQGNTVTYVAMQLAFHMGFEKVALIGCDHSFAVSGPANKTVRAQGEDRSHFDPHYFAEGSQWQLPDLIESEASYQRARRVYEFHGREIINATLGGKLEIFERQSLKEFLAT